MVPIPLVYLFVSLSVNTFHFVLIFDLFFTYLSLIHTPALPQNYKHPLKYPNTWSSLSFSTLFWKPFSLSPPSSWRNLNWLIFHLSETHFSIFLTESSVFWVFLSPFLSHLVGWIMTPQSCAHSSSQDLCLCCFTWQKERGRCDWGPWHGRLFWIIHVGLV